jgi:HK97 family phage portal protein
MGLGASFRRTEPDPEQHNRWAGSGFEMIIDGNPINVPLQAYGGGLGLPAAWRASMKISDAIGSVNWDLWRIVRNRRIRLPRPSLLQQPAPPEMLMTTFSSWALDLVWHGNAVGLIASRDEDGVPDAILPIPANQVGVRRVGYEGRTGLPLGAIRYSIGGQEFGRDEMFHVKGPCQPSDVRGWGVLEAHLRGWSGSGAGALDLALELNRQAAAAGGGDGVPTGILKSDNPDLDETEAADMRRQWYRNQRERSIQVLNATTSFEALAWNPTELQLVEARKMSLLETALIFGLQPSDLGAETSNRTYRNDNAEDVKFTKWGLRGYLGRFVAELSRLWMDPNVWVLPDTDEFTRPDALTQAQIGQIQVTSRTRTPNELRASDGLPPIEGGDEFPATAPAVPQNDDTGGADNGDEQEQDEQGGDPEDSGPDDTGIGG